jgi:ribosomal protein S18 acetylase RimI-like enzyme
MFWPMAEIILRKEMKKARVQRIPQRLESVVHLAKDFVLFVKETSANAVRTHKPTFALNLQSSKIQHDFLPQQARLRVLQTHCLTERLSFTVNFPMQIRRLSSPDANAFQALRLQALRECPSAFSSSYEEEVELPITIIAVRLAAELGRDMFGAFSETELVGTIGFGREGARKLAHKGFIRGMYVSPAFRNQGIGRQLVSHVLQHAASLSGLRQVTLTVTASNVAAIGLYEKMGFTSFGLEPAALLVESELHDEIYMVRFVEQT